MKTSPKTKYEPHNPDDLGEGWDAVAEYAEDTILAAFDGCHKIYLAMDEEQAEWFRSNYDQTVEADAEENLVLVVREWYDESCMLKFVQAVFTDHDNPNAGYVVLIGQGAGDEGDEDEDEDEDY